MAEFTKNTNKKPYAKSNNSDNRRGGYDKKPHYTDDKNKKNYYFDKDCDDNSRDFRKSYKKTPIQQQRTPVHRPRGIEAPDDVSEVIEYKMSAALAETLLKADKSKRSPQEILCEYVNTQCGLKGYCVRVSYF